MTPLIIPCPNRVNCPGSDNPFANLTMEAPDSEIFIGINFGRPGLVPRLGWSWSNPRGHAFCGSNVSQADAELCADKQAFFDQVDDPPGDPDPGHWRDQNGNPPPIFNSAAQVCSVICPDGLPFTYQVAPGIVSDLVQADADAAARSIACNLASVNRVCLDTFNRSACINLPYQSTIVITGRGPFTVHLIGGSLPPGLTLASASTEETPNALQLLGIPTTLGTYVFTLQVVNPVGNFQQKTFTVVVWGFALPSGNTLPDYHVGVPYSFQFAGTGGTPPYTFETADLDSEQEIEDAGLTLSSSGLLSGTPTQTGSITFNVSITDSS